MDRLLQFQEIRRALAHLDMLMLEMETGAPNIAPIFARAAARLSRYADDFAGSEYSGTFGEVRGGENEEVG